MPAAVGLDVGVDAVAVCVLLPDGSEPVARWEIPNTQPGAQSLVRRLAELAEQQGIETLQLGMEATSLYWWPLACTLTTAEVLRPYQPQVYALNPKLIKSFRQTYGTVPKTDRPDAFVIADRIRLGRQLPPPFSVDWRYAPLQRMTRFRMHLAQTLAREKSYFVTFLFLRFSGYCQTKIFEDRFGATGCAVLEEFTTEELAQASVETLATFVQTKGRGQFDHPEEVAAGLQQAAKDSYHLERQLADPLNLVLGTTMASIRSLQGQLKAVDRTIAQELAGVPQTISTIPGLGPVWTAGLIAEIGNIHRFRDDAALAQYAGLTWTVRESGRFQADDTQLTKTGNKYLRYYLVEAANSVREHCPEYTAYYQAKYAQTPKHPHKRALVLTARKLVRLLDALLRANTIYQPPEHRQNRKEQTPPRNERPARHHRTRRATAIS